MSTPLTASSRCLKHFVNLTLRQSQSRNLHMTGAASQPSRYLTSEPPAKPSITTTPSITTPTTIINAPRTFTTTPSTRASRDASTIDFAFLPSPHLLFDSSADLPPLRVPILPHNFLPAKANGDGFDILAEVPIHRTVISTAGGDHEHVNSADALAHKVEGEGIGGVDFEGVKEFVNEAVEKVKVGKGAEVVEEAGGWVGKVWSGLLDDLMGPKGGKVARS